jgi:hypothetical protein
MHYLLVIMSGCYNVDTNNMIETLASEGVTFSTHAISREYPTACNLFDNALLVITISHTALSMVTSYSNFMEQTCSGAYSHTQVKSEDRAFHRNMLLLISTSQLLERTTSKGINPKIKGIHNIFVFLRRMWTYIWVLFPVCDEFTSVRR